MIGVKAVGTDRAQVTNGETVIGKIPSVDPSGILVAGSVIKVRSDSKALPCHFVKCKASSSIKCNVILFMSNIVLCRALTQLLTAINTTVVFKNYRSVNSYTFYFITLITPAPL
jgi:hypothetical protein